MKSPLLTMQSVRMPAEDLEVIRFTSTTVLRRGLPAKDSLSTCPNVAGV